MNWFKIAESQRRKRKRHVGESLEARLLLAADFRFDGLLGSAEKQTSEAPESLRLSEIGSPLSVSGRDGTPNGAYAFDGDDYLSLGNAHEVVGQTINAEFWVKTTGAMAESVIIGGTRGNGSRHFFTAGIAGERGQQGDRIAVEIGTPSSSVYATSTSSITDGRWHHVVINVFNSPQATIEIFVDGNLEASTNADFTFSPESYDQGWQVGALVNWQSHAIQRHFTGSIDNVTIDSTRSVQGNVFFDDFNRPNGAIGNGWTSGFTGNGVPMTIENGRAVNPNTNLGGNASSAAWIHRPIPNSNEVQISGTLYETMAASGNGSRFEAGVQIGSTGGQLSGFGVWFGRSSNEYNDSGVHIAKDGVILARFLSPFQFIDAIHFSFLIRRDGFVKGEISEGRNVFAFESTHQIAELSGDRLTLWTGPRDDRGNPGPLPRFDDIFIAPASISVGLDAAGIVIREDHARVRMMYETDRVGSPFQVGLFKSTDGQFDANDMQLGLTWVVPFQSGLVSVELTFNSVVKINPFNEKLLLVIDPFKELADDDPSNNTVEIMLEGIDKWWATAGDSNLYTINWVVDVPYGANVDINYLTASGWRLTGSNMDAGRILVNALPAAEFVPQLAIGRYFAKASLGHLEEGVHILTMEGFRIPETAGVADATFQLTTAVDNLPVDVTPQLNAKLIADHLERFTHTSEFTVIVDQESKTLDGAKELIDYFAPSLFFSAGERYAIPFDVETSLLADYQRRTSGRPSVTGYPEVKL